MLFAVHKPSPSNPAETFVCCRFLLHSCDRAAVHVLLNSFACTALYCCSEEEGEAQEAGSQEEGGGAAKKCANVGSEQHAVYEAGGRCCACLQLRCAVCF